MYESTVYVILSYPKKYIFLCLAHKLIWIWWEMLYYPSHKNLYLCLDPVRVLHAKPRRPQKLRFSSARDRNNRRKIRLKESNTKCRHLNKLTCKHVRLHMMTNSSMSLGKYWEYIMWGRQSAIHSGLCAVIAMLIVRCVEEEGRAGVLNVGTVHGRRNYKDINP